MTDIDLLREALRSKTDEQIEEIYFAVQVERNNRDYKREKINLHMLIGTRVRTIRGGKKLPKHAEGVLEEVKRTRCLVAFDKQGRYRLPLCMIEPL